MQGSKLYVGNFSYSMTDEQLEKLFAPFGQIKSVTVIGNKGFGFVEMSSTAEAEKALAGVLDPKWSAGRTVIQAVIDGTPKVEIIRYASKQNIDLIVLSTHGRTGLPHLMMGSVAESIVRTSPCPVLTVRPEGHQFVMP